MSLATVRRGALGWLFASALLVVGVWVACGGGGGGNSSPPPPAPVISLSPTSLTFGQQMTGTTSAAQSVWFGNAASSPATLLVSSITIGGTNPGDFADTAPCGSSILPSYTCDINVTFTPTAAGPRSASLIITDNASGSPQTVSLSGTGVAPATTISLSASSLTFGQENMWATSAAQTVTLSNTGNGSLSISGISIVGPNFAQTNTCGSSVAAGANCSIGVVFSPIETGPVSALLTIADNASGSPQTVSLSGAGAPPVTPAGTYYCTVYAASGSDSHTPTLAINVQ